MIQDPLCWDARVLMPYIIITSRTDLYARHPWLTPAVPIKVTLWAQSKIRTIVQHPILDLFHHILPPSARILQI